VISSIQISRYFRAFLLSLAIGAPLLGGRFADAQEVPLVPFVNGSPLPIPTPNPANNEAILFQVPAGQAVTLKPQAAWTPPASGPLYLEVMYLDQGYGHLAVTFEGTDGKMDKADKPTHAYFLDSGKWVTCYLRLNGIALTASPEIDITREKGTPDGVSIAKAGLQTQPFADAHFQYLLNEAWKRPYAGPSLPPPDNTTLKGKIMVGYQGWFSTPNDPYDHQDFSHWGDIYKGHFSTDMWPNPADYPASALDKACDVKTLSGKQGYLFSPAWPETALTQFGWMKQNNIDGVFVQRFVGGHSFAINGFPDWVLGNVRAAAHQTGRLWAIEYDASGLSNENILPILTKDWEWMSDDLQITKDPNYARENGKPVVFVWGLGVADRKFTPDVTAQVADFFKNDPKYGGNYIIVGAPGNWRKLSPDWLAAYQKWDGLQGWMSTNYAEDLAQCKQMGIDYYGHAKPGFSWANTMHIPTGSLLAFTPRDGGRFLEESLAKAAAAGVDRMVIGMFDEYNESTAIMPMSDDPPPTPVEPGTQVDFFPAPKPQGNGPSMSKLQVELTLDGQPPAKKIPGENFSMKWVGSIKPPTDGSYTLSIEGAAGDQATLWINDKQVLKIASIGAGQEQSAVVPMTAGKLVNYRIEYSHGMAQGTFRLDWEAPGMKAAEPIPADALVDAWGRFLTNEGNPPDLYLKLAGEGRDMMNGKRAPTDLSIPPDSSTHP
jgi:hypothetical protein